MTVKEAIATLEAKVQGSFAIELDVWSHQYEQTGSRDRTVEWSIYISDRHEHFKHMDLAAAVNAAIGQVDPAIDAASEATTDTTGL